MDKSFLSEEAQERVRFNRLAMSINTAVPGIVRAWDATRCIARVQPAIQMKVVLGNGTVQYIDPPVIEDVPACLPASVTAGLFLTIPIAPGDPCLIIFGKVGIDNFVQSGQIAPPPTGDNAATSEDRHHDLTDAMFIPGLMAVANKITAWQSDAIELRTADRSVYLSLKSDGIHIKGNVVVDGEVTANDIPLSSHKHSGVQSGSSSTGGPHV